MAPVKPIIVEWPRVSFRDLSNMEIKSKSVRVFYKSILLPFRVPELIIAAFVVILRAEVR